MRCEHCQDLMVEALYGELEGDAQKRFDEHIVGCEACTAELAEMQSTLEVMSKRERRNPGQAYWDGYWNRLSARMEEEQAARGSTRVAWWRRSVMGGASSRISWVYRAAAAAAILMVGIFAGRTFFLPEATPPGAVAPEVEVATEDPAVQSTPAEEGGVDQRGAIDAPAEEVATRQRSVPDEKVTTPAPRVTPAVDAAAAAADERAMCYVEKSQLLLVALVNNDSNDPDAFAGGFGEQRRRSAQLVAQAAAIKDDLDDPRQRRLLALVTELEKILLQISNLESDEDIESVEFIRSRVNDHDVLLKINLEQLRHGAEDDGCAAPDREGVSSDV